MWYAWETRPTYTGYWLENLKESDNWEYLGVYESIILKLILKKGVGGRGLDSIDCR